MSTEERVARLEGAFATLADVAAAHQRLHADGQRRVRGLEESVAAMVEVTRAHDEAHDELRAAQAETERKIGNLVDAQIRTEDAVRELAAAQRRTEAALAGFIVRADERLSKLEDGFSTLVRLVSDMDARLSAVEGRGGG